MYAPKRRGGRGVGAGVGVGAGGGRELLEIRQANRQINDFGPVIGP